MRNPIVWVAAIITTLMLVACERNGLGGYTNPFVTRDHIPYCQITTPSGIAFKPCKEVKHDEQV